MNKLVKRENYKEKTPSTAIMRLGAL